MRFSSVAKRVTIRLKHYLILPFSRYRLACVEQADESTSICAEKKLPHLLLPLIMFMQGLIVK